MQSSLEKALAVLATSLVSALISLLLAAIVFLCDRHPGEPPLTAILVGVGSLFIADCYVRREPRTLRKAASIILGAIVALVFLPEVGGRFALRVDELFSTDRLHFGAVSFSVAGGPSAASPSTDAVPAAGAGSRMARLMWWLQAMFNNCE